MERPVWFGGWAQYIDTPRISSSMKVRRRGQMESRMSFLEPEPVKPAKAVAPCYTDRRHGHRHSQVMGGLHPMGGQFPDGDDWIREAEGSLQNLPLSSPQIGETIPVGQGHQWRPSHRPQAGEWRMCLKTLEMRSYCQIAYVSCRILVYWPLCQAWRLLQLWMQALYNDRCRCHTVFILQNLPIIPVESVPAF